MSLALLRPVTSPTAIEGGMSKAPWFKFYAKDWRSSPHVLLLTDEEKALYIDMLALAWEETPPCSVPSSPEVLGKVLGRTSRKLRRILSGNLRNSWEEKDGRLYNLKLMEQADNQNRISEIRANAARVRHLRVVANAEQLLSKGVCKASSIESDPESEAEKNLHLVPKSGASRAAARPPKLKFPKAKEQSEADRQEYALADFAIRYHAQRFLEAKGITPPAPKGWEKKKLLGVMTAMDPGNLRKGLALTLMALDFFFDRDGEKFKLWSALDMRGLGLFCAKAADIRAMGEFLAQDAAKAARHFQEMGYFPAKESGA